MSLSDILQWHCALATVRSRHALPGDVVAKAHHYEKNQPDAHKTLRLGLCNGIGLQQRVRVNPLRGLYPHKDQPEIPVCVNPSFRFLFEVAGKRLTRRRLHRHR